MTTHPPLPRTTDLEPCSACGAPVAADQRWCLECGERRAGVTPPPARVAASPAAPRAEEPRGWTPGTGVAAGIGVLLLAMGVGVLIGRAGHDTGSHAAAPAVVTVAGTGAGAATPTATTASFQSDWPRGKDGWTVQLQALPKDGNQPAAVAAAKSAAAAKGAPAVGALDSDEFSGLAGGSYLVYSGVYASKKAATKALARLKGKFPGARVVHVSAGGGGGASSASGGSDKGATPQKVSKQQLKQLNNLSPQQYQKQSQKLPKKVATPGKPPPKDNKKAGGGSGSVEIG